MSEARILQTAAAIGNPWGSVDLAAIDKTLLERAAETLERQKVSLLGLAERLDADAGTSPVSAWIERDRTRYRVQRDEFERIRTSLDGAGVETMLFKSVGSYPGFQYLTSNLDVIVPEGKSRPARERLVDMGYVELVNVEEPKKYLFRRFPGDGSSHAFHLHEVVGWGVPFVDNERLWAGARPADDDPAITIPGPPEALLVTLAHWFYEDKALSLGNLFATAHAVRHLGAPLAEPAVAARGRGWEEGYWAALRVFDEAWRRLFGEAFLDREQLAELDEGLRNRGFVTRSLLPRVRYGSGAPATIPFVHNKLAYYRKIARDRRRSRPEKLRDVVATLLWAVRWKLHVRSQKPLLVTVSGCDGSGKTVQVERLARVFDTCDIRKRVIWSRGGSSRFMAAAIGAAKAVTGGARTSSDTAGDGGEQTRMQDRRKRAANPLLRFLYSVVFALDLTAVYAIKTRILLWMGNAVIADRYVFDALVDFAVMTGGDPAAPPRALRWLLACSPRPHAAFLLDVEPAEALRRKPEEGGTEHLEQSTSAFRERADAWRLRVVPPAMTVDHVQRKLARESLDVFYERYGTVINRLLWSDPEQLNPRGTS